MDINSDCPAEFGRLASIPRQRLFAGTTALESMPNLSAHCGGARLFVKRDDCTGLAFGGNKVRQLEFYFGDACANNADTILITGAVQSNFVRMVAAGASKLGLSCHIQLEERVASKDPQYHTSGNIFLDKILGATLHSYPEGEDESGADDQLEAIASEMRANGHNPYVIHLAPGHAPLGSLGYVVAAFELLTQINASGFAVDEIFVPSGSGATHAGLLFGLRALGSTIPVRGVCVRRDATSQKVRILETCRQIGKLLECPSCVADADISLTDTFLAPGYGIPNPATMSAIIHCAQTEGLLLDPVYTGKAMAELLRAAETSDDNANFVFIHTGGTPALFGYQRSIETVLANIDENRSKNISANTMKAGHL